MNRYLKLYLHFWRFSLSRALEFRVDFFFRIFMDIMFAIMNILFFKIIFLHTPLLVGWTESHMIIFIGIFLLIDAINMTIFANNMWYLPFFINKGDLDYYLTRPVSSLFMLTTRDIAVNSMVNFLVSLGVLYWGVTSSNFSFSAFNIFLATLYIINGIFLMWATRLLFILPVFWTHSGRGFDAIYFNMEMTYERPDKIFKGFFRILMTTIFPFALMASYPARFLFGDYILKDVIWVTIASASIYLFIVFLWNKGLSSYSSASS